MVTTEKRNRRRRIQQKKNHIRRQAKLRKELLYLINPDAEFEDHRLHKRNALNCGNPKCIMCGNPRKFFGEKTIQEIKHELTAKDWEREEWTKVYDYE